MTRLALLTLSALLFTGAAYAEDKAPAAKPYPKTTCIVSDEKLGEMGDAVVYVHEGQELKFCCKSCIKDFKKDPAKYLKKLDDAKAGSDGKAK